VLCVSQGPFIYRRCLFQSPGTTWHSAGLLWRLRPNDTDIQLIAKTHEILQVIEAETGINPGWVNNGGMFIAHNQVLIVDARRDDSAI
jgi:sarcosine dehydrogenase